MGKVTIANPPKAVHRLAILPCEFSNLGYRVLPPIRCAEDRTLPVMRKKHLAGQNAANGKQWKTLTRWWSHVGEQNLNCELQDACVSPLKEDLLNIEITESGTVKCRICCLRCFTFG